MRPAASTDRHERRFPPSIIVCLSVLSVEIATMLLLRFRVIPVFVDKFKGMSAEKGGLPELTQYVLSSVWAVAGPAALLAAMAASLLPWRVRSRLWVLVVMAVLGLAAIAVTVVSLYLPTKVG